MAESGRPAATGAQSFSLDVRTRLRSWMRHHRNTASGTVNELVGSWITTLMTSLVIGIALALPGILFLIVSNLMAVSADWQGGPRLSVYFDQPSEMNARAAELRQWPEIISVEVITPNQAIDEFQQISGFGDVLNSLDRNPLPGVLVVAPGSGEPAQIRLLSERLAEVEGVTSVSSDIAWIERLYAMLTIGERLVMAMSLVLALGVCLIVGNTIRLAIESRRAEIEVVKLVGGTDAFVRRPFLYLGLWFGLGGGILAWLLIEFSLIFISGPVAQLASSYNSDFVMTGLGFSGSMLLLLGGMLLGVVGSGLAVSRHLGEIEPQ